MLMRIAVLGLVLGVAGCGGGERETAPTEEPAAPTAPAASLYERLGGADAITGRR